MEPAEGTRSLHDGRYVLLAPLGRGSQGTTWDAVDRREGRAVAVKAFDVRGAKAWKDVELAEREANVLAQLDHPSLPRYFEHFEEGGVLYLVMEKVTGTPLSALRARGASMSEAEALRLLEGADATLAYLHGRSPPVVHRDLKPSNVIRRDDGSYAFVDFGAVRDRLRPEGGSTVVGTFGYMAPEQFQGRAGPATDVYAIGATVMAMLTGLEPEKLPHRGLALDVEAALGETVSPRTRAILAQLLEPDPDKRPVRIGPVLRESAGRQPSDRREAPQPSTRERRVYADADATVDAGLRAAKRARRELRRESKRIKREARQGWPRGRRYWLPFPLRIVFGLAIALARVAITLTLGVAVPLVLSILSLVFGDAAKRAAAEVRGVASLANRGLDEVHAVLNDRERPSTEEGGRVTSPGPRVSAPGPQAGARVAAPERPAARDGEEDALTEEDELPSSRARQQRRF